MTFMWQWDVQVILDSLIKMIVQDKVQGMEAVGLFGTGMHGLKIGMGMGDGGYGPHR